MKKFELTTETKINIFGKKLFRIKALISFGPISAGEKGGWVEKEENLSQSGNAWVFGNAEVYDNALDNCMLYTMLTRAKKRCLLCAEPQAFYKCLNTSNNARNTWLSTIKRKGK